MSSVQVIVGSMLGGSEYVAEAAMDILEDAGHKTQLHLKPKFSEIPFENEIWLVCTSTHGTGELPDNIKTFAETVDALDSKLTGLKFAIIGLGDSGYDSFCQAGEIMEDLLASKGAIKLVDNLQIDARNVGDDPEETAENWVSKNITVFS